MRVAIVLLGLGALGFVASGAWFVRELLHIATEPRVPHDHFAAVVLGFVVSMALLAGSIAVLLEGRARRRSGAGRSARPRR